MKIGFVVDDTLDKPDGVQQYVLTVSKWLKDQGHEIHYLVGESSRTDLENVHSLSKNVHVRFNKNRLSIPLPASTRKLKELLQKHEFDVLHVQMPHNPFLAAKIVRMSGPKTVIIGTFHIAPYSQFETHATRLLGLWLRRNLKYFDRIISVSTAAQSFAKETFKVDSVVIPNAVDVNSFRAKRIPQPKPTITFLGRLVKRKGCEHLLRALAELEKTFDYTNYQVNICSDGEERAKLEQLCRTLQLQDKVTFHGYITETEKKRYLASSDVAVYPSTGGESFGIVLIEAMAAGSQVVLAGDNPGYTTVMGEIPEAMIDPFNVKGFARSLHRFLSDKTQAQKVHQKQQELIKQYDIAVVGPQILDIYRDLIAKKITQKHN